MRDRLAGFGCDSADPASMQERLPVVDPFRGIERNEIVLIQVARVCARGLDVVVSDQDLPGSGRHEGFAPHGLEGLFNTRIAGAASRRHLFGIESSNLGHARGPRRPPLRSMCDLIFVVEHAFRSGRMLHPGDWVTFFDFDSNGEIVAVDIEGNVNVLWMQTDNDSVTKVSEFFQSNLER